MSLLTTTTGTATPVARRSGTARTDRTRRRGVLLAAPAIAVIALVTLVPIAFSVYLSLSAVRPGVEGFEFTFVGLANYAEALQNPAVWEAFAFTGTYTVVSVTLQIALGLAVALAIDRMTRWAGITLAMLLIPWAMITVVSAQLWSYIFNGVYGIANYLLMLVGVIEAPVTFLGNPTGAFVALLVADTLILRGMGWLNSYQALIVPYVAFGLPLAIWVMRNSLLPISPQMEEAAEMDGASTLRTIIQIIVPQALPGIFVAAVLTFVSCWQEFLMALSFNASAQYQTAPVGIALFGGAFQLPFGTIFAASLVALVPIFVLVLLLRRWVVDGLSTGAVKG